MEVRLANESDLPAMLAIYNDVILTTTAVWQNDPHTLEMRKEWFTVKKEQGHPVYVAVEQGMVIGFSTYGPFRQWQCYYLTVENSVYVAAANRGRGVAKLLLTSLIDTAKEKGLHAMVAGIEATNDSSVALHKKFGFVEVAHFKEVGFKFDRWLDLKFLQLIL